MDSQPSTPNTILSHLSRLVSDTYTTVFQVYNDRFVSFSLLFQELQKKQIVLLEDFHQALLELEKQQQFLLGGYSKKEDVPAPQMALYLPDRGYLYWIFQPEPPSTNSETTSVVVDFF